MASPPRRYGRGVYGIGPYGHNLPGSILSVGATAAITFQVQARGIVRVRQLGAMTGIEFGVQADLMWTWNETAPCEIGTWTREYPPWADAA